jgi:hypothetical protein
MVVLALIFGAVADAQQGPNPRQQPGAAVTLFAPDQHDLYDGHFVLSAGRLYMVGGLNDKSPWDHMDNAAASVRPPRARPRSTWTRSRTRDDSRHA